MQLYCQKSQSQEKCDRKDLQQISDFHGSGMQTCIQVTDPYHVQTPYTCTVNISEILNVSICKPKHLPWTQKYTTMTIKPTFT